MSKSCLRRTIGLWLLAALLMFWSFGGDPAALQAAEGPRVHLPLVLAWQPPTSTDTPTPTPTPTFAPTPTRIPTSTPTPVAGWSAFELRVVELTNQERSAAGCSVMLAADDLLHQAAAGPSVDMIARDFFSHTNPDGQGPGDRLDAVGYDWSTWGENIAAGYTTPEAVVSGWMASPGHRANILNCNFTEIGVGYAYAADDPGSVRYHHYWTQVLARPG